LRGLNHSLLNSAAKHIEKIIDVLRVRGGARKERQDAKEYEWARGDDPHGLNPCRA